MKGGKTGATGPTPDVWSVIPSVGTVILNSNNNFAPNVNSVVFTFLKNGVAVTSKCSYNVYRYTSNGKSKIASTTGTSYTYTPSAGDVIFAGYGVELVDGSNILASAFVAINITAQNAMSYGLKRMDGTKITVAPISGIGSSSDSTYKMSGMLYYQVWKKVGTAAAKIISITSFKVMEGTTEITSVSEAKKTDNGADGIKWELSAHGTYNANILPPDILQVTIVADGMTFYDNVPVGMTAGVAINIDNKLGLVSADVSNNKKSIASIKATGDNISAKVASMAGGNLLYDAAFMDTFTKDGNVYLADKYGTNMYEIRTAADAQLQELVDGTNGITQFTNLSYEVPIQGGGTFVFSFYALAQNSVELSVQACDNDENQIGSIVEKTIELSEREKRYFVSFTVKGAYVTSDGISATSFVHIGITPTDEFTYFWHPQLEYGTEPTAWSVSAVDAYLATGIDIYNKKITLTADNVLVRNNSGTTTAMLDSNGKLRTDMIDTDELVARRIMTKNEGNGRTEIHDNTTVWYQKDGATPGIKVTYDDVGLPHLIFYSTTGEEMYDLGASGLQSLLQGVQPASILARDMYSIDNVVNTPVALSSLISGTPTPVGTYTCAYTMGSGGTKIYVIQSSDYSALDLKVIVGYSAVDKNGNDYKNFTLANGYWMKAFTLENNDVKHYVSANGVSGPGNERGWHDMPFSGSGAYHFSVPCLQFSDGVCVKAGYIYISVSYTATVVTSDTGSKIYMYKENIDFIADKNGKSLDTGTYPYLWSLMAKTS